MDTQQHTQPFRSCVLLLKCFNCMDAFAVDSAQASFF
nr:MAG TPA: hypothetical protein [Caudoviricetes sp.]